MDKLKLLRKEMEKNGLDGFVVPMSDEFNNEYVPAHSRRLEWLTGFTGSAGLAIVLKNKAAFFTDGRYTLQASAQVSASYKKYNISEISPAKWVQKNLPKNGTLGINLWLHTENNFQQYNKLCSEAGIKINPCGDLFSRIWKNRPDTASGNIFIHDIKYSGQSSDNKIKNIVKVLKGKKAEFAIITAPDSICWLLNIRGADLPHTPIVLCYAIISKTGKVSLYLLDKNSMSKGVKKHLGKNVVIKSIEDDFEGDIKALKNKPVLVDPASSPAAIFDLLKKAKIVRETDPCILPKSCKNKTEIEGIKKAHIRDGSALCKFFHWLEENVDSGKVNEISAADKLEAIRSKNDNFHSLSFDTIAGFAGNGAIVHYRATPKSNKKIKKDGILLLDSGAQYLDGTTDVTRTIATAKPTAEQKRNFTLVLKGHIALATAKFKKGTTGSELDRLARQFLKKEGLDYDHGTGHGVGCFLSVHEGPQRISKVPNKVPLVPGMVISNEPGYYKEGEYGIRIENLVTVIPAGKNFLKFETLTQAPIDASLIDKKILTQKEIDWVNDYHKNVRAKVSPLLDVRTREWLKDKTKEI